MKYIWPFLLVLLIGCSKPLEGTVADKVFEPAHDDVPDKYYLRVVDDAGYGFHKVQVDKDKYHKSKINDHFCGK